MIIFYPITSFSLLGQSISVHGLFMALGALAGWIAAKRPARENRLDPAILENAVTVAVLAGIVGARVGYVVLFGRDMTLFQMLAIWEGGLVSHAGYLFGAAGCIAYLKWKRQPIAAWADILAPSVVLGWAVGRIGDFLSWGEFGIPSSLPWAVSAFGTARHPTQIYESLAYLGVFLLTYFLGKKKGWVARPGMTAAFATLGFGLSRFAIDFLRADPEGYRFVSQTVSLAVACVSLIALKRIRQARVPARS